MTWAHFYDSSGLTLEGSRWAVISLLMVDWVYKGSIDQAIVCPHTHTHTHTDFRLTEHEESFSNFKNSGLV